MIVYMKRLVYVNNDVNYLLVDSDEEGWKYIMRVGSFGEINTLHINELSNRWNAVVGPEDNQRLFEAIPEVIIAGDVLKRCQLAQLLRDTYWLARR